MSGAVFQLKNNQLRAADPDNNVWLSASAGTGKTQVLSARVLRLLLRRDVDPSQVLCLTFTKAGAAEMANRINAVLARWVRLEPGALGKELSYLGADIDPDTQSRARTLFARVLDCPGGGLRIDTIHAFSQWLLANFPEEANIPPGASAMEDRERELLAREVLSEMLVEAERDGDKAITGAVSHFAMVKDPDALRGWLMRCAAAADMWEGQAAWKAPMRERVLRLLDMPADADAGWVEDALHPDTFPDHQLAVILPLMQAWSAKAGQACSEFIPEWLATPPGQRGEKVERFFETVLTKKGQPRSMVNPAKTDPQLPERQEEIAQAVALYVERVTLLELANFLTMSFEMGCAFAKRWEEAKLREGLLDFDDLIRKAARLLKNTGSADWIRYKLDRSFDHILIDEAQDTNASQWDIVFALIDDFFSGEGAHGDALRTIFTVGDYKQAIFGFQGTSPKNFENAKQRVKSRIDDAKANALDLRDNRRLPGWADLDLGQSFRTSLPVLDFVNRTIDGLGHEAFGLTKTPEPHEGDDRPGLVAMWRPVFASPSPDNSETGESNGENSTESNRDWLPAHDTLLAEKIADQVREWVSGDDPFVLAKGTRRHAEAGDIMVLVRKRKDLAAQIVAKLHARGVAVAGVDRLRLGAPLAVKDLMAALRFAAQPLDDLSLANLLASPLIGWSQDDLLEHAPRAKKQRLWHHLRKIDAPFVAETVLRLRELLARADFDTPQSLLAWMLTGPWAARRKLVARLGSEANDPIDELVNAAFAYQSAHPPSLAGFIEWFDAGEGELKRDADEATGQVRVMTVHGSKGLQAPIVILADATGEPGKAGALDLPDDPVGTQGERARRVPLPSLSKDERAGPILQAEEAASTAAMQEHWRLLYVAMTRAEEALFIGGALGTRQAKKGEPHEDSWYARLEPIFDTPPQSDAIWGERREFGARADPIVPGETDAKPPALATLPDWALQPVGQEPRPPKPLAPSRAGEELGADPPLSSDATGIAARRGILIHRLLEQLPNIERDEREELALSWLERQASDLDPAQRAEIAQSALAVLADPDFAGIFSAEALAEVPLSATVGGLVVAGTADRLLVRDEEVIVIDFKTTRRPPETLDQVPRSTLRQMAAYAAALEVIYPGKRVRAALLYTHAPRLIDIPQVTLDAHKDRLGEAQESYTALHIE